MNGEITKKVPKGIRYLSDWKEFRFELFPSKCIVDKQIPGCGYTEWAITCPQNVIIASPRKMLLQNKADQHEGEVFLVVNEEDKDPSVDIDLYAKPTNKKEEVIVKTDEERINFRNKLYKEIESYTIDKATRGQHSKILVTYDSYYIVKGILKELGKFQYFHTVVDEFQTLLQDSRFKSDTELKFMEALEDVEKVQFVSATPILRRYLEMLDDFKDMPYRELDWKTLDPGRVRKPEFEGIHTMKSVGEKLALVIGKYQRGEYESKFVVDKETGEVRRVVSDEAVLYVNSVKHIVAIIKKCGLTPEETNILCANTPANLKKIKSVLGKQWGIGSVPLKGTKPKKFTFCTRTVYLGADFYSECARSFIFSDSNIDCLAVDIIQDIQQIFGRQRLSENPWKNSATIYYRATADYNKMTEEDFKKELEKKMNESESLLRTWDNTGSFDRVSLARVYEVNARTNHYKQDYVSVNNGEAVFNQYAHVADIRAFDIQQKDYADRFTVFANYAENYGDVEDQEVAKVLNVYKDINGETWKRLQLICEFYFEFGPSRTQTLLDQLQEVDPVKEVFLAAGPERCKANGYSISKIKNELGLSIFNMDELDSKIYSEFHEGDCWLKANIKDSLQKIFDDCGYQRKAKSTTIEDWFETSGAYMNINGKRINGIKLKSRKRV